MQLPVRQQKLPHRHHQQQQIPNVIRYCSNGERWGARWDKRLFFFRTNSCSLNYCGASSQLLYKKTCCRINLFLQYNQTKNLFRRRAKVFFFQICVILPHLSLFRAPRLGAHCHCLLFVIVHPVGQDSRCTIVSNWICQSVGGVAQW